MSTEPLNIIEADSPSEQASFLDLPYRIYRDDPNWRPPLRFERKDGLTRGKNPSLNRITEQLFLAMRGDKAVGRIAAFLNEAHRDVHHDNAGHFGFFDCEDDPEAMRALLDTAQTWLRGKGCAKMIGPAHWTVNEEVGQLVDGFDTPPVIFMPHGRPDYIPVMEAFGLEKATDMLAFQADLHGGYPRPRFLQTLLKMADEDPTVALRKADPKNLKSEVALAMNIFNDAWAQNWGFIPFSDDQIDHMSEDMKPILDKDLFLIGEIDGEAAAFLILVPDLNEAAAGLDGRLFPFGWAKLLWRLKVKGVKQSRIPLMGLRREHHNTKRGLALVAQLCETSFANARDKGFERCELSWVLEDNKSMIRIAEQSSAVPYKTYRMYEKTL